MIDFSCIEMMMMMMYPTILWLDMMRKDLTPYIKAKVFDNYDLATQNSEFVLKTGGVRKRKEKADISTVFPSWAELVGDDPVLSSAGIVQYVTKNDCTPSKKQLLNARFNDGECTETLCCTSTSLKILNKEKILR